MTLLSHRGRKLRSVWDQRVDRWSSTVDASPAFALLREHMLDIADPVATDRCLDLGAGAGFMTIALVDRAASVHAVDISPEMLLALRANVPPTGAVVLPDRVAALMADQVDLHEPGHRVIPLRPGPDRDRVLQQ